jgi:ribose transport system ATP-binding protein
MTMNSKPRPAPQPAPFLAIETISKAYPGVVALADVSMTVQAGEVLGLIGENGAGKSTLMNILGGVIAPSSGRIVIDNVVYERLSVTESHAAGIAFVHQELNVFDNLDVAANIFLGREMQFGPLGLMDLKGMRVWGRDLGRRRGCLTCRWRKGNCSKLPRRCRPERGW